MNTMDSITVNTFYNRLIEHLNITLTFAAQVGECHTEHSSTLRQKLNIITKLENLSQLVITFTFYNKYGLCKSDESFWNTLRYYNKRQLLFIIKHALGTLLYFDKIITIYL